MAAKFELSRQAASQLFLALVCAEATLSKDPRTHAQREWDQKRLKEALQQPALRQWMADTKASGLQIALSYNPDESRNKFWWFLDTLIRAIKYNGHGTPTMDRALAEVLLKEAQVLLAKDRR